MPRNSVSSMMLAASGPMVPGEHLPPPPDLSGGAPARDEWNRIVTTMPAGFLTAEHQTLLRELVRHTLFARAFGEMAEGLLLEVRYLPREDARWRDLRRALDQHCQQTEKVQKLSRSLRITKTSRYDKYDTATKRSTAAPPPWLDWNPNAKRKPDKPVDTN